jgi:TrmH family RNA methyltransferase
MPKPETITSPANPLLKDIRRAVARDSLTYDGWCVAETFHLLEEALRSPCEVKVVLLSESESAPLPDLRGARLIRLPDSLLRSISGAETSPGVLALVKPFQWELEQLFNNCPLVVVLDGLQDPGNCGAIGRVAEAFGATGIIFLKGTASPFNSKTLRASAGSLFRVPFVHGFDAPTALAAFDRLAVRLFAGVPNRPGVLNLADANLACPCAVVIGNEARGISVEMRNASSEITIPTASVESLNAAVAAGILLYEAGRQRKADR